MHQGSLRNSEPEMSERAALTEDVKLNGRNGQNRTKEIRGTCGQREWTLDPAESDTQQAGRPKFQEPSPNARRIGLLVSAWLDPLGSCTGPVRMGGPSRSAGQR